MTGKLFKDTSKKSWASNACIGGPFTNGFSYANGYYESAKILVDQALSERKNYLKDSLFYPICYNYRHFVEIILKELIIIAEKFYYKTEKLGYEKNKLTKKISKGLKQNHSIESLLQLLELGLDTVSDEKFDSDIRGILIELHNMDSNSQIFRYAMTTKNKPSFKNQQYMDLSYLKAKMEEVYNYLSGIDGWLDHHNQMADNMIEEMESMYRP